MVNNILNSNPDNVNGNFELILQGVPINSLMTIQNKNLNPDNFTHSAEISINGVRITIRNYNNLKIDTTTFRFLDYLLIKMCKYLPYDRNNPATDDKLSQWQIIKISVSDYMKMTDLSNQSRTKSQIEESLTALQNLSLSWCEKVYKKKKINYIDFDMNIVTAFEPIRGGFYIRFDMKFLRYLSNYSYIMPFDIRIFKIDLHKNPNSYQIVKRLLLHLNMNQGKSNHNIISVKKLLEFTTLPAYIDIKQIGGIQQRIVEPFKRDINYLVEIGILSNVIVPNISDYKNWSRSNVTFIISDYLYKSKS